MPRPLLATLYALMASYGIALLLHFSRRLDLSVFYLLVFMLYGIALGRAWVLSGAFAEST